MNKKQLILSSCVLALMLITLSSFSFVSDEEMFLMGISEEQLKNIKKDVVIGQTGQIDFPKCHTSLIRNL